MSDLDRLHKIIDALPPQQIHALLTFLDTGESISDEEFRRRLEAASEEEVDEETLARIVLLGEVVVECLPPPGTERLVM